MTKITDKESSARRSTRTLTRRTGERNESDKEGEEDHGKCAESWDSEGRVKWDVVGVRDSALRECPRSGVGHEERSLVSRPLVQAIAEEKATGVAAKRE